jgi:hypothetical protein
MENNIKLLSEVSTLGLKKDIFKKSIEDEKGFYFLALENGLVGAIYHALQKEHISPILHEHLTKDYYAYLASDVKYQKAIKKLNTILNSNMIDHIFLKGAVLKDLYPESYMRAMGDIDILIKEKDLKRVQQLFKDEGILLAHKSDAHDLFIMYQEITVEIHPKLYKDFNPKYEVLLTQPWKYAIQKDLFEFRLKPEFEVVYLLYHLAKHLDSSGIGLRSVLDISVYVKTYENDIDVPLLNELLSSVDLKAFFTHILKINEIFFGYKGLNQFYLVETLKRERYDDMIDYISTSGIHGKGRAFNPFEARISSNQMKHKSFFIFLVFLAFPRYRDMKGMYPVLEKWKILLPLTWIFRWFDLFVRRGKSTFKRILKLRVKKCDLERTKGILKDLGL